MIARLLVAGGMLLSFTAGWLSCLFMGLWAHKFVQTPLPNEDDREYLGDGDACVAIANLR